MRLSLTSGVLPMSSETEPTAAGKRGVSPMVVGVAAAAVAEEEKKDVAMLRWDGGAGADGGAAKLDLIVITEFPGRYKGGGK